ncbi:MAG: hypothetical protein GY841_09285 [FCB group bacterium]|nr:hypothetical protein [FCB group bacterium]
MADRLIIFEDGNFGDFYPLTLSRPAYMLRCGAKMLWEKIAANFDGYEINFACRPEMTQIVKAQLGHNVNQLNYQENDRLVFINGRLRLGPKLAEELKQGDTNRIFRQGETTAAYVIAQPLDKKPEDLTDLASRDAADQMIGKCDVAEGEFEFYNHLWNLVDLNSTEISNDFQTLAGKFDLASMLEEARVDTSARILSPDNIYIAAGAEIGANAVIDNRHGPVIIDRNAMIGPLSYIEGPCYIGPDTQIFRGNIREGCSFGPSCRVGGEVEESIFQGFTNKYHDGFLGHAYLGSWVNLGAMTTNSDLKNNYKNITVSVNGRSVDTGLMKIGSYIGDHSKTGIGTLLNTGISIGFSCNIYGGTLVTSREVPSFSWGDEKGYDIYRLDKAMEVARSAMSRRNQEFTAFDERLFAQIHEQAIANR